MIDDQEVAHARMRMLQALRTINREVIHGLVPNLDIETLTPFFNLVAKARGLYIKRLIEIAAADDGKLPTEAQVRELSHLRRSYEELLSGGHVMETAIERGYIDVKKP